MLVDSLYLIHLLVILKLQSFEFQEEIEKLKQSLDEIKKSKSMLVDSLYLIHLLVILILQSFEFQEEIEKLNQSLDEIKKSKSMLVDSLYLIHLLVILKLQSFEFQEEIEKLKQSLDEIKKSKSELEDLNSEWAEKSMEITKQLRDAKVMNSRAIVIFLPLLFLCVLKCIFSQSSDLFNGQINYYLKIYTFDLSLNLPYITTMLHLLDLFCPLLDKDISIENLYIALSCPIK